MQKHVMKKTAKFVKEVNRTKAKFATRHLLNTNIIISGLLAAIIF